MLLAEDMVALNLIIQVPVQNAKRDIVWILMANAVNAIQHAKHAYLAAGYILMIAFHAMMDLF